MINFRVQSVRPALMLLASGFLTGCQYHNSASGQLSTILANGELIVATRNAPTTYYELHDEPTGPEHDLIEAFARHLGVKVRFVVEDTVGDVLQAVADGEADLGAAGLTRTPGRERKFLFGPVYQQVEQQLVCRDGGKNPRSVADMVNVNLSVPSDTSYVDELKKLQKSYPMLHWQAVDDDTESLLEDVYNKQLDCTIADSNIVAINRRYYPELRVQFNLTQPQPLSWVMPGTANDLQAAVTQWLAEYKKQGKFKTVMERYYGYINEFDYVDTVKFKQRILTVLPKYKDEFMAAANKYGLDWTLLAAQSYQESHWKPRAISPTGVRGMMMLTLDTAREMGIHSRLDPKQSIFGGAEYFRDLYDRIPGMVKPPDRNWFALAAYNIGIGHLYDARVLAKRLGKNPNLWSDLSTVFPLLSNRKYYKRLQHGYARGRESVSYVQHIRDYHDILNQSVNNMSQREEAGVKRSLVVASRSAAGYNAR
ncbi:MAG: membrane-bound lytic murein transglycosylase MltF [Gammaproteobacteria bacterium]